MSLVDSLPSTPPFHPHRLDTSNKLDVSPGTHTPPIKTTTNTVPHLTQPQLQAAASIPSSPASGLNIPGAYPREKSGTSVGMSASAAIQSAAETARSYLPTGLVNYSRTSPLISGNATPRFLLIVFSECENNILAVDGEGGC